MSTIRLCGTARDLTLETLKRDAEAKKCYDKARALGYV